MDSSGERGLIPCFYPSSVGEKNTAGDLAIILLLEILDKMPLTRRMHGILKRSAWKSLWIRVTVSSRERRSVVEPSVETRSLRLSSWEKSKTFERETLEWPLKPRVKFPSAGVSFLCFLERRDRSVGLLTFSQRQPLSKALLQNACERMHFVAADSLILTLCKTLFSELSKEMEI